MEHLKKEHLESFIRDSIPDNFTGTEKNIRISRYEYIFNIQSDIFFVVPHTYNNITYYEILADKPSQNIKHFEVSKNYFFEKV